MSDSVSVGSWLKSRRKDLDLTQEALAEQVKCTVFTIRRIEAGTMRPSRQLADLLAKALEVPPADQPNFVQWLRSQPPTRNVARPAPAAEPPRRPVAGSRLPRPPTRFLGRTSEVAAILGRLQRPDIRLLTLTGPPGIGKTRLAVEVAARCECENRRPVAFVPLSAVTEPRLVPAAIARALGIKETAKPLAETLIDYLRDQNLLLVLDNFEHLIAARRFVSDLIAACPQLTVLVTSRTALRLYGEHLAPVPPIELPEPNVILVLPSWEEYAGIALFAERARAVAPDFALTEITAPIVAEICRQLDGLPLAIELAAARSKLLSPETLLARLSNRLQLLTAGAADLPARQQTLRGAIAWSHDLLDEWEQRVFRRMSVFARGGTLEAIEASCRLPGEQGRDVLEGVASLLDKSLLRRGQTSDREVRLRMLWTIREYAWERLAEAGEAAIVQEQHARFYLALAETAEPYLRSAAREAWLARLDSDLENIRAALTWCLARADGAEWGLRLAGSLHWFWYFRGYLTEGRDWLEKALTHAGPARRTPAGAMALTAAGRLALILNHSETMRSRLEEAVAVWRELGQQRGLAYALSNLGVAMVYRDHDRTGYTLIEEAVSLLRALDDRWSLAFTLDILAESEVMLGDIGRGSAHYEESITLYREVGDQGGVAAELGELARVELRRGQYVQAQTRLEEALAIQRVVSDPWNAAHSLRSLGDAALCQGDEARAEGFYREGFDLYRQFGDRLRMGALLRSLGHVARRQGRYTEARAYYTEGLALARAVGSQAGSAWGLAALAGLAAVEGRLLRAARLFGAVAVWAATIQEAMPPPDRVEQDYYLTLLREQLDGATFAAAWAAGETLPRAQALAAALDPAELPDDRPAGAPTAPILV
jgi:predicted ATPase/transcriptional regulator with XRE-family HTH domain